MGTVALIETLAAGKHRLRVCEFGSMEFTVVAKGSFGGLFGGEGQPLKTVLQNISDDRSQQTLV